MDFYRAGRIPLDRLSSFKDEAERMRFMEEVFERHRKAVIPYPKEELKKAFAEIILLFPFFSPYQGTQEQRSNIQNITAVLLRRYSDGIRLDRSNKTSGLRVVVHPELEKEIFMLKQLTWHYVLLNPRLNSLQFGQRRIIRELFDALQDAATTGGYSLFPNETRDALEAAERDHDLTIRVVADHIAGMSEAQAFKAYSVLTGHSFSEDGNS